MANGKLNGNGKKWVLLTKLWIVVFSILVFLMAGIVFVEVYPFKTVVYEKVVFQNDVVRAGEPITYTVFFKKYTSRVGNQTRYLYSSGTSSLQISSGLADAKITDTQKLVTIEIPKFVLPGKYKVRWVVSYDYFGIRSVVISYETPEFTVVR